MRLYAMVWYFNALIWDLKASLCYVVRCKRYALIVVVRMIVAVVVACIAFMIQHDDIMMYCMHRFYDTGDG